MKSILRDLIDKLQLNKQDKTDNALTTTSKEVIGAINENKNNIDLKADKSSKKSSFSSTGWYRIARYDVSQSIPAIYKVKGANANSLDIKLKRAYNNTTNEFYDIKLASVYESSEFIVISKKIKTQLITKIRHTVDTTNMYAYIEIYYSGINDNPILVELLNNSDNEGIFWKAIAPEVTTETVSGVTVYSTCDLTSSTNSIVTGKQMEEKVDIHELTNGQDLNTCINKRYYRTVLTSIIASLLNKPIEINGGEIFLEYKPMYNGNNYGEQILTSKIGTNVRNYIRCNDNGTWSAWTQVATTDKIDTLLLPFASGVTDWTVFGQRTHYEKNSFGEVKINCWCQFTNTTKADNVNGFLLATMPSGYRPIKSISGIAKIYLNGVYTGTDTTTCGVVVTDTGIVTLLGFDYIGTNNVAMFSIEYSTT